MRRFGSKSGVLFLTLVFSFSMVSINASTVVSGLTVEVPSASVSFDPAAVKNWGLELYSSIRSHAIDSPDIGIEDDILPLRITWNDVKFLTENGWKSPIDDAAIPLPSSKILKTTGVLLFGKESYVYFNFRQNSTIMIVASYQGSNLLIQCLTGSTEIPLPAGYPYETNGTKKAASVALSADDYVHFFQGSKAIRGVNGLFLDRAPFDGLNGLSYSINASLIVNNSRKTFVVGSGVGAARLAYFVGKDLGNGWRKYGIGAYQSDSVFTDGISKENVTNVLSIPNKFSWSAVFGSSWRQYYNIPFLSNTKFVGSDNDAGFVLDSLFLSPYISDPQQITFQSPTSLFGTSYIGYNYETADYILAKSICSYNTAFERSWVGRSIIRVRFEDYRETVDVRLGWHLSFLGNFTNGQQSGQATGFGLYLFNEQLPESAAQEFNGTWTAKALLAASYQYDDNFFGAYAAVFDKPNNINRYVTTSLDTVFNGDKKTIRVQTVWDGNKRFGHDIKEFDNMLSPVLMKDYVYGWIGRFFVSKNNGQGFSPSKPQIINDTSEIDQYFKETIPPIITVNLTVSNVTNLSSWQAGIVFNANAIECLSFQEGEFLKNAGSTVWITGSINNVKGIITPYQSYLGGGHSVNGTGRLAQFAFKFKKQGIFDLHLINVELRRSDEQIIPHNTLDTCNIFLENNYQTILMQGNQAEFLNHTFAETEFEGKLNFNTIVHNVDENFSLCMVTIPKTLIYRSFRSDWTIIIDQASTAFTITENATNSFLKFMLNNGTHEVEMRSSLAIRGDINLDGTVNIRDAVFVGLAWHSTKNNANYNPLVDFNADGLIDIKDAAILALHWQGR